MRHFNIPIFVPHQGCPHDCVFCNQKKITGVQSADIEAAKAVIKTYLNTIEKEQAYIEIAFFGGSFTGIPIVEQEAYLSLANSYLKLGLIDGIRLSTRPDYIDEKILKLLKNYGVTSIELGVQSLDERVLDLSNRGHDFSSVVSACELIKQYNFELGLQMMLGLPGDTIETAIETALKIIELKPKTVRIYPTLVIDETELCDMYQKKLYEPLSLEEAVEQAAVIYEMFLENNIQVIKLGLHPSEDLMASGIISGPFHPAFRQLVESYRWLKLINNCIDNKTESILIRSNKKDISNISGHKKSNKIYFEQKGIYFKVETIEIEQGSAEIVIDNQLLTEVKITTMSK